MATKFVYSDSEIKEIIEKYKAGVSLDVLATEYIKSVASVRMKLVKLGVYVAQAKSSGTKPVSQIKSEFQDAYAAVGPALL